MVTNAGVVLLEDLNLRNGRRASMLSLEEAIVEPPELVLTMDGACTLTVVVADGDRTLTRSPLISEKSWSEVLGVRFELTAVRKSGDRVTLIYEDTVTAALRRRDGKMVIPANSSTRAGIVQRLAKEAGVPALIDPAKRKQVHRAVKRGGDVNSWDLTGDLAEEVKLRRFSTGTQLVFGSDQWLAARMRPVRLTEHTGSVRTIDFDLDQGKRASKATVQIDASFGALPPGQPVTLDGVGPADGDWLVRTFRRTLSSTQANVELTRARHVMAEPKGPGRGEHGEQDFLPGVGNGTDAGGTAANAARARMVAFALAQNGKAYVWGASGPNAYDCSGLVQQATAAAGRRLTKPSASQWAAVQAAGKTMSVDTAVRTRGALLFRIGGGDFNHVAISLGNGSTIEAMGSSYGVCIGSASGRGWTGAGWWV